MQEYLIYGDTLTEIAESIRQAQTPLPIKLEYVGQDNSIHGVEKRINEYVDSLGQGLDISGEKSKGKVFCKYSLEEIANGEKVITLWHWDVDEGDEFRFQIDYEEPHYYIGRVSMNGELYDKWRRIEKGENSAFGWNSDQKHYVYTDPIVVDTPNFPMDPLDMPEYVREIPSLSSPGSATADDILSGEQAWVDGKLIVGNIEIITPEKDELQAWVSNNEQDASLGASITIKKGYYSKDYTLTLNEDIPYAEGAAYTPTTTDKTLARKNDYVLDDIKVTGDANLISKNIKRGISIFGVQGECFDLADYAPLAIQGITNVSYSFPKYSTYQFYSQEDCIEGYKKLFGSDENFERPCSWYEDQQDADIAEYTIKNNNKLCKLSVVVSATCDYYYPDGQYTGTQKFDNYLEVDPEKTKYSFFEVTENSDMERWTFNFYLRWDLV